MKNIMVGILITMLCVAVISCSNDPNPQICVRNERLDNINVMIHTSTNNELRVNNLEPGKTSSYQPASEGNITAIAVIQNESISFIAEKNTRYTIVIKNGIPPELLVDKE